MLINLSNHPSEKWTKKQLETAAQFGEIVDLPFPEVKPDGDEEYIKLLVDEYLQKIHSQLPILNSQLTVHIMGEMTFTFAMIHALKEEGIHCIASTTERIVEEENGIKKSIFQFVKFRKYE